MKKVLIICYDYPPYNSIGAHRPYSWFRYLKKYGVEPVIVTRHWNEKSDTELDYIKPTLVQETTVEKSEMGTVIRVPHKPSLRDRILLKYGYNKYKLFRRLLSMFHMIFRYLGMAFDSTSNIYHAAEDYISKNKVDAVIATGEPWINFRYGYLLSRKFKIDFYPDYRDNWTTSANIDGVGRFGKWLNLNFFRKLEMKYIRGAKSIICSDPDVVENLQSLHTGKPIIHIFNGFEEEMLKGVKDVAQSKDKFIIGYSGTIYAFQPLELFFEGYKKFISQNPGISTCCYFYGANFKKQWTNRILNYDKMLNAYLIPTDRIPQKEVLRNLKSANVLLILADDHHILLPSKIFEYFALERKILLVKNDHNVNEQMVNQTNAGYICSDSQDVATYLSKMYEEWKATGEVKSSTMNYQQYSREHQAEQLAKSLLS